MKFRQLTDGGHAIYETEKTRLEIIHRVRQVDKTSKFDAKGMPAYIVRSESQIVAMDKLEEMVKTGALLSSEIDAH